MTEWNIMNWTKVIEVLRLSADKDMEKVKNSIDLPDAIYSYRMASFSILTSLAIALEAGLEEGDSK